MGDRANAFLTDTTDKDFDGGRLGLVVYTHWYGSEFPDMVESAIRASRDRWTDAHYLARIIVDQLTKPGRDQTTGFGLGLSIADNEHPIVCIDMGTNEVGFADSGSYRDRSAWRRVRSFTDIATGGPLVHPTDR